MTTPAASESDPSTALHSLFKSFDPLMKTLALVALFSNTLGVFPGISGFPLSLATTPVLLGAAFLLGSFIRPAAAGNNAKVGGNEHGEDDPKRTLAVTDPLGVYFKSCLFGYLVFQLSRPSSIDFPVPPNIPSWAVWALAAAAAVAALFTPTTKLYGPIRFAYLQCSRAVFPALSELDWWRYPVLLLALGPALLPAAAASIGSPGSLGVAIITCTCVYRAYDAQLHTVAEDVGRHVAVANLALASAREYGAVAMRFEEHLLSKASTQEKLSATHAYAAAALQRDYGDKTADSEASPNSPDAVFAAALAADEAARLAEKAVSAARNGDMAEARQHAAATKAAADGILSVMETAHREMHQVRGLLRTSLGSQNAKER